MSLAAPNLDDRTFQELVNEAKLRLGGRCPEWTDHNVSDPGVMLIELVAGMVDQLIFRLNQVPDRMYVKFLELIGVHAAPATAATAPVTFWLSAPQPTTVRIEAGTQVATKRTTSEPAIVFTVVADRAIPPCEIASVRVVTAGGASVDRNAQVRAAEPFSCFSEPPVPGDALVIELTTEVAGCAVRLDIDCDPAYGKGIDPARPPLIWEVRVDGTWSPCEATDATGGLNRAGTVILHVPASADDDPDAVEATLVRCLVTGGTDRPPYERSPRLVGLRAVTIGATAQAVHGELRAYEELGVSDGSPAQRFTLADRPATLPKDDPVVESRSATGVDVWTCVEDFASSGPADRHFTFDARGGEVAFGPALRWPDEPEPRQHGAVPPAGARLVLRRYMGGGGGGGNLGAGALSVLKSTIPFVARVENRAPAHGGRDAETSEEVKRRGPVDLRSRGRAVTVEDYEYFARLAAPGARVRCKAADDQALAQLVIIPRVVDTLDDPAPLERLQPSADVLAAVRRELDKRRVIGARFGVGPAGFKGLRVDALVRVMAGWDPIETEHRAAEALHAYFHPITGGNEGTGWPFGRDVHSGMAYVVLQRVPGVEIVQELRLYEVDVQSGRRLDAVQRLYLEDDTVVVSRAHKVAAVHEERE